MSSNSSSSSSSGASTSSASASASTLPSRKFRDIVILSKRSTKDQAKLKNEGYIIIDVTSSSKVKRHQMFSPFYPHGGIPIPIPEFKEAGITSECVEGVWQGLKVFENGVGIDEELFKNATMKNLKRTVRSNGTVQGHYFGKNNKLLGIVEARDKIFIPSYRYALEKYLKTDVENLRKQAKESNIVLLDFMTNGNVENTNSPLSHAQLLKEYILTGNMTGRFQEIINDGEVEEDEEDVE